MNKNTRNSGLELLRILAAFGVIILHYNNSGFGGGFKYVTEGSPNVWILYFTESLFIAAVNVFVIISGYFLSRTGKRRFVRIAELLLQVILFNVILYLISWITGEAEWSWKTFFLHFIPDNYYVILYCALYILSPYINLVLNKLDDKALRKLTILLFSVFSLWNFGTDALVKLFGQGYNDLSTVGMYGTQYGYTIVNFCLLYVIGAYIGRMKKKPGKALSGGISAVLVLLIFACVTAEKKLGSGRLMSLDYDSPLVIALAAALLLWFSRMSFRSKTINELAGAVFTSYLLNGFLLKYAGVRNFVNRNPGLLILHQCAVGIGVFLISYAVYKVYFFATNRFIKRITPICDKVRISLEEDKAEP